MDWLATVSIPLCLFMGTCDPPPSTPDVPARVLHLGDCKNLEGFLYACRRQRAAVYAHVPLDLRDGIR